MAYMTRLPLEGTFNTRELGGYPTRSGITNWQTFLRSDDLFSMTSKDIAYLENYGVQTIIDLRSEDEVKKRPCPSLQSIDYKNLPLITGNIPDATKLPPGESYSMGEFYLSCLQHGTDRIKAVLDCIAESEGCTLFHCAAGKDRTGIIAALLLGLAEVGREDIIANYQTTHTYLQANPVFSQPQIAGFPIEMLYSSPDYIACVLDYLMTHYYSVTHYLTEIGVSETTVKTIAERFVRSNELV